MTQITWRNRNPKQKVDVARSWADGWQRAKEDREIRERSQAAMLRAGQQLRERGGRPS